MSQNHALAGSPARGDAADLPASTSRAPGDGWRALAKNLLLASLITLAVGLVAVRISTRYYAEAPYHYDSAGFRWNAYSAYGLLHTQGIRSTIAATLRAKDSLDVLVRVLLLPPSLVHPYGHFAVLVPFMWLFILLTVHYVYARTRSRICSIAIPTFLLALPIAFDPFVVGIADYWKDNIAVWMLAGAVMSFLLSQGLERRFFAGLAGALLGLLAMERTALAIYATPLILPLVAIATYRRHRSHGLRDAVLRLGVFAACPAAIAGLLVVAQARQLYKYYFVAGYAYTSMLGVAEYLVGPMLMQQGFTPIVLFLTCLLLFGQVVRSHARDRDARLGIWIALAFPLIVIASRGRYQNFGVVWTVLLIVMLATVFPAFLRSVRSRRPFVVGLVLLLGACSLHQYRASVARAAAMARNVAPKRRFHDALATIVLGEPAPRRVALLYDEDEMPFLNHVLFNRHVPLDTPGALTIVGFMSIHDSYYRTAFGDAPQQQIQDTVLAALEGEPGTMVVGFCRPEAVHTSPTFSTDGKKVATPVALELNRHLLASVHWVVLAKLESPYGCTYVYQYRPQATSSADKWQRLSP